MELGGAGPGKSQCPQLPWPAGGGVEGWSQLSKQGSEVTEVGGRAASRRDREAESTRPSQEGQRRGRNGVEAEEAWPALGAQAPAGGSSLPSPTHRLWDWGSGCRLVVVAAAAAAVWVRGRLGQSIRRKAGAGGPDDWASSPCLTALGVGCVRLPACLCHLSKPLFSLLLLSPASFWVCLSSSLAVASFL